MKVPITKPLFDHQEIEAISSVINSGWIVQGPCVEEFEKLFADYTGVRFAKAVSNCTAGLHLSLNAQDIKKGDKVIVPSFTYIASANSVEYTGAEVLFCDIDLKTFNIDVNKVEELLIDDRKGRIKAIMPVHLFGLCADMPKIMKLAKKHNLKVIEDAACGFDAWIGNKHAGAFGDAGCFSFHPRKNITTGEGGMIITDDEAYAARVASLRDHGASKSDLQRHKETGGSLLPNFDVKGYNYRMTDIQGVLGVCQMKKAKYIQKRRRELAKRYDAAFNDFENLITPRIPENYTHGYQSYVCLFSAGEEISKLSLEKINQLNILRNKFMKTLEGEGISTRQGTHAVHTLGYYKRKYHLSNSDYINSYAADRLTIALPLFPGMTEEEQNYVIEKIKGASLEQ